jgi:hypothetical protein
MDILMSLIFSFPGLYVDQAGGIYRRICQYKRFGGLDPSCITAQLRTTALRTEYTRHILPVSLL